MNAICNETAQLMLKETNVMISLPEICVRLKQILADPEHSRKDVAEVMKLDPALSARLLRIVNSAYFGLPYRVNSVTQALGILGEQELKNLVMVTSIMKMTGELDNGIDIQSFWRSSVFAAVLARNLCTPDQAHSREEYFLTGLLLNVGKLLLYARDPRLQLSVKQEMAQNRCSEIIAEQNLTSTDHCCVGAILANSWNFSETLSEAIRCHHQPLSTFADSQSLVIAAIAGYFSDISETIESSMSDTNFLQACPYSPDSLGLNAEQFLNIMSDSFEEHVQIFEAFCG